MKKIFVLFQAVSFCSIVVGQQNINAINKIEGKPAIDSTVFGSWPIISEAGLSSNGRYVWYSTFNKPVKQSSLLTIKRTDDKDWQVEFAKVKNAVFTRDSKNIIFKNELDTLVMMDLETRKIDRIGNIESYKLIKAADDNELLVYTSKPSNRKLIIRDFKNGSVKIFDDILEYKTCDNGEVLILKQSHYEKGSNNEMIKWVNLRGGTSNIVLEGGKSSNFIFDSKGSRVAFIQENENRKSIWQYNAELNLATKLTGDTCFGNDSCFYIDRIVYFNKDGSRLFIKCKKNLDISTISTVNMDMWSYRDVRISTRPFRSEQTFLFILDINANKTIQLHEDNGEVKVIEKKDIVLVSQTQGGAEDEWNWNSASIPKFFKMDVNTGRRELLKLYFPSLSPEGKYLIGTDTSIDGICNNIITYNLETKQYKNITKSIPVPRNEQEGFRWKTLKHRGLQLASGFEIQGRIIVNDRYDLWLIDLAGARQALNITNGYGRKKQIRFRLAFPNYNEAINKNGVISLTAFDDRNKMSGFYKIDINKIADPKVLSMQEASFKQLSRSDESATNIVFIESSSHSSNVFWSNDLKSFHQISNNYPEKNYNWLNSQLISWESLDGNKLQGVLYKPDNFDSTRKYPVIFNIYETRSNELNLYKIPTASKDVLNIPWFVSNGYLVFTPDIYYTKGNPGLSAYNSIVSAAKYLKKYTWVDSKHLGLQGHSFGGFETNYLITHTNLFAGVVSAAASSDLISSYGTMMNGISKGYFFEIHQYRIGKSLWDNPNIYIENSPVLEADKITSPLLIMHNKKDGAVSYTQGIEFFLALRRLQKKVWFLQYDEGNHSLIDDSKDAQDYHLRMAQFFNHYLKSAPAPIWMTQGIPAKLKGIQTGYTLNPTGNCGTNQNPCKICTSWNTKMAKDSAGTWKEIERRQIEEPSSFKCSINKK